MDLSDQLRQVTRRLVRTPMFLAVTLITLAAGVGANALVFSVLDGILLKPLPYPHPEQLVGVALNAPGVGLKDMSLAPSNWFIFREQGRAFQNIGLSTANSVTVTGVADPERVRELEITHDVIPVLGVQPALGRAFRSEDDAPGAPKTVMLGYGYWQRKFGADPNVIGRPLLLSGEQYEIVGVLPASFHFLDQTDPAVVTLLQFDRNKTRLGNFSFQGVARLKPGVTIEQASADVARMLPTVMQSFPPPDGFSLKLFEDAHISPSLHPLKQDVIGDVGNLLWVLMGSITLVLLIACANVANLMLVRMEGRRHEIALRAALGATWNRIASEMLMESLVLGLVGGTLGLGLAYGGLRVLTAIAPANLPRIREVGLDGPVLLFTLFVSLFASFLSAAIPVFKHAGARLTGAMREGGRGLSQSREQHRARGALVVLQVSLALVLLICSGLMFRTFHALTQVNPGFTEPEQLQLFRVTVPEGQVKDDETAIRMLESILHKIEAVPGVRAAGINSTVPMTGDSWNDPVFVETVQLPEGKLPPLRRFKFVAPGGIGVLGTPFVAGRDFTWQDLYGRAPVAIISENMSREYWSKPAEALGKRIRVGQNDDWREIVGVVGDMHDNGLEKEAPSVAYWPVLVKNFEGGQFTAMRSVAFYVRSSRVDTESFLKELRAAVWSVNANLPLADVHTLDYYYRRSMARTSFTLIMLGVAGSMALLLGVVGLYGVIAYSVSQRTREIGIRMALGAQQASLTNLFVRQGLLLTGVGVACGLVASALSMRLMTSLLFHVNPVDPLTYAAVSAGLLLTAWIACYLPSRRAATMDPVVALRAD